jgi:nitroimidazol reductase NimA-like FMN-containing flavoprotein (pyridoxamine 5'-phosphate oxidase superfamily)
MSYDHAWIAEYMRKTRFIVLATVNGGRPAVRTIAAFAADGLAPVFSTHKDTDKVSQLAANPHVSILFEHENQNLRSFVNMTVSGIAHRVDDERERDRIIGLIGARNLRYQERAARGDLVEQVFYRVEPLEMSILDFKKSPSPQGVERITFGRSARTARAA